ERGDDARRGLSQRQAHRAGHHRLRPSISVLAERANGAAKAAFCRCDSPSDNKQTIISRHARAVAQATPGRRALIFSSYTASAGLKNREQESTPATVTCCALLMTETS